MRNAFEFKIDKSRLLDRDYHWKDRKSIKKSKESKENAPDNEEPAVICFVQVNLPSGSKKIIIREGDNVEKLAESFSKEYCFFILLILIKLPLALDAEMKSQLT